MISVNTVILGGHLGADPEEKRLATGKLLCAFRLAVNRWDSKADEAVVDWHSVTAFERQAELCLKYLRKGAPVLVEGRLQLRQWDGADGKRHTRCEVIATRVSFLGSRAADEGRGVERPVGGGGPAALPTPSFADQVPF